MHTRTAVVIGATGLIGRELVEVLCSEKRYEQVKVVTRRPFSSKYSRVVNYVLEDFASLASLKDQLHGEDYFCALGTTIKEAGSKEEFEKVDYQYPLEFAQIAQSSPRFRQYLVVTALGAKEGSPIFYNRVKGKLEESLKRLGLSSLKIFRPSLLLGKRDNARFGEEVAKVITKVISVLAVGLKRRPGAIPAKTVAQAMVIAADLNEPVVKSYSPKQMYRLVSQKGL